MAADVSSTGQIQEFLRVLRRRRWQIVMPAIFVLAIGTVFAVLVPKKYVIETRVEVKEGTRAETDPALKSRAGSAVTREIWNVAHHLKNYKRIGEVVNSEGGLWPEYMIADAVGQREVTERIISNLTVSQAEKNKQEGSTFVDIVYRDVDGERGVRFLQDLIERWVQEVIKSDELVVTEELDVYQVEEAEAFRAYQDARDAYTRLAKEIGVDPSNFQAGDLNRNKDPIFEQISRTQESLSAVELLLDTAKETLETVETLRREAPELVPSRTEVDLIEYRERAEEQIRDLERRRQDWLENNSKWIRVQHEIDAIERLLVEEEARLLEESPQIPNEDLPLYERKVNEAREEVATYTGQQRYLTGVLEDLRADSERRIDQLSQLETLKLAMEESRGEYREVSSIAYHKNLTLAQLQVYAEPYEIVRPPEVEGAKTEPSATLLVLLFGALGLALGLSSALAAEYARNSYRTVADVAAVMTIPVLGTIDAIVTSAEARRTQARRAVVGLSSAVILGGLAWFTWVWSVSPDKLPTEVRQAIEEFRKLLM